MGDYRKLAVWEKSHEFTLNVYRATASFPKEELYGLTSQIRRASVSIASNIVEGSGRGGDAELIRFLRIAAGSAHEVEYQLLLAHDLGFLSKELYQQLETESVQIKRMLAGLIQKLEIRRNSS
jgi:four helix bundle protein